MYAENSFVMKTKILVKTHFNSCYKYLEGLKFGLKTKNNLTLKCKERLYHVYFLCQNRLYKRMKSKKKSNVPNPNSNPTISWLEMVA